MESEEQRQRLADEYIRLETRVEDLQYEFEDTVRAQQEVADDFGYQFPCDSLSEAVQAARVRRIKRLSEELRELEARLKTA